MRYKLTGLVVGEVELTKRQYLHRIATAPTHTATTATIIATSKATTATKNEATTINSTASATTTKTKNIKAKT